MIRYWMRRAREEALTFLLIALDVSLGFVLWLLVAALVPGDAVGFNVVGSLVLIALCIAPWFLLDRIVQKRVG